MTKHQTEFIKNLFAPGAVAVMTPEQIAQLVLMVLDHRDNYDRRFDSLPQRLKINHVAQFLNISRAQVNKLRKDGVLNFIERENERPYIAKAQFIKDCKENKLI